MVKGVMELYQIVVVVTWLYVFVKTHRIVYQKRVNFTVCKFYLSKLEYMYKFSMQDKLPLKSRNLRNAVY